MKHQFYVKVYCIDCDVAEDFPQEEGETIKETFTEAKQNFICDCEED